MAKPIHSSIRHLLGHMGWGIESRRETRLLTRLLEEVWFSGHACHTFLASLFTSLFAGKREVAPKLGGECFSTLETEHLGHPWSLHQGPWKAGDSESENKREEMASMRPKT